jgi:hypothetical protein
MKRSRFSRVGGAAVACALLVAVGCSGGGPSADEPADERGVDAAEVVESTTSTSTTSTTTTAPAADPVADAAIAEAAVVTAADLPAGWEAYGPTRSYSGADLDEHICGSGDDLPPHTAGFDAQFIESGAGVGQIVHAVFIAPTEADAAQEFAAVDSPEYESCAAQSVGRMGSRGGAPVSTEVTRGSLPPGIPGIVDRFTTAYDQNQSCACPVAFVTFVRMQVGRAIVRLPIIRFDRHLTDTELQPIVEQAHALAVAAQGETG